MSLPEPRYHIGQTVYCASWNLIQKKVPCPDCLDTGKWRVATPAGDEFEATCPRCSFPHGEMKVPVFEPVTQKLTIGSIRTNSAEKPERRVEYMCVETGVGSGRIYGESSLFRTREEAERQADFLAKDAQENHPSKDHFDRTAAIAEYRILDKQREGEAERRRRLSWLLRDASQIVFGTDGQERTDSEVVADLRGLLEEWET